MRTLFKQTAETQKEFENVHGTNIRNSASIKSLEKRPEWFDGKDNPQDALGKNGDYFVNRTTGEILKKENGRWG